MPTAALIVAAILLLPVSAVALDPTESSLVEWIREHDEPALELLQRLVEINSGTMNFDGVRRVADVLTAEYEALGFATEWVDGTAFDRAGHLVARHRAGSAGNRLRLLLIGHLDTVFEPDSPFQSFERLDANRARGPGTTDMKGGNVVMLQALKALASAGALDEMDVTVILTGDEERSGRPLEAARAVLIEAAREADVAVGFEDGDGRPETAVISRRGSGTWTLEISARPAHSSQIFQPEVGAGAIFEASRVLSAFREGLAAEPDLTFNPGVIVGGTDVDFDAAGARGTAFGKNNVIAARAVVTGDLRATSPEQYLRATERMRAIVHEQPPHADSSLSFSPAYPPMAATTGNRRLLALYDQVSRDLGYGPVAAVNPRNAGAADISFAAEFVEMALDGIGLMGTGGHTLEETADLSTLPMQTERAAVLMLRLARDAARR